MGLRPISHCDLEEVELYKSDTRPAAPRLPPLIWNVFYHLTFFTKKDTMIVHFYKMHFWLLFDNFLWKSLIMVKCEFIFDCVKLYCCNFAE